MAIEKYITPHSFDAFEMKDVLEFHDRTKLKPISSMSFFLRTGLYMDSIRGAQEASKNYKATPLYHTELLDVDVPERLHKAIKQRRSCRNFDRSIPFNRLGLLRALISCTPTRKAKAHVDENIHLNFRPYPSPGGLYPVEIHLLEPSDNGFDLKYFNPHTSTLHMIRRNISVTEVENALCVGSDKSLVHTTRGAILLSVLWERTVIKYGIAGYRFALIELGIVSQHLSLILADQDIETLNWGAFYDDKGTELIGADPCLETLGSVIWYGN
ncbi:TPA: nitroreductase family protein [Vibrio cholerae]|uniref:Dehydrogenase n=1 Tax=Vibrio paracholerae TaxID=650003 RepID=A0ABD7FRR7_9VIBR|nr:nitroreductase family protein [Vibrio paracholerae]RBM59500.1 dehydrogenase [Vibrio paracholerae]